MPIVPLVSRFACRATRVLVTRALPAASGCTKEAPRTRFAAQQPVRKLTSYGVDIDQLPEYERLRILQILVETESEKQGLQYQIKRLQGTNFGLLRDNQLLHRQLTSSMYLAGVVDGDSFLEYIKCTHADDTSNDTAAWRCVLNKHEDLTKDLLRRIPTWAKDCRYSQSVEGVLASKLASLHDALRNELNTFVPGLGLIVIKGMPDEETATALECVARHFKINVQVKEPLR